MLSTSLGITNSSLPKAVASPDAHIWILKSQGKIGAKAIEDLFSGAESADMSERPLHVMAIRLLFVADVARKPPPAAWESQPPTPILTMLSNMAAQAASM